MRPPLNLSYPFPEGRESETEAMRHYDASDGTRHHIDPNFDLRKLQYFHFAREIEQTIQSRRSNMTKSEKTEDNRNRDLNKQRLQLQDSQSKISPATENIYSRTDEEGNVIVPDNGPKRSDHFWTGCGTYD